MNSLRKLAPGMSWRIAATLACVAIAASPGLAARRHAPHATQPTGTGTAGGTSPPAGQTKLEGGDAPGPQDTAPKGTPKGQADGGKAAEGKSVGPIDLTRPDDGYANLRRRAARTSLIAAQKKLLVVSPPPHLPAITTSEHPRNAAGATVPVTPPAAVGLAKPEPVHVESTTFGAAKNNLGLGATGAHPAPIHTATTPGPPKPPVGGINGTNLHPAGTGIGGPAKDHSAIAGSSYKHK